MTGAREVILKGLYRVTEEGAYSNRVLKEMLQNPSLAAKDRAFVTEVFMGVIRNEKKLDYIIARYSKMKIKKLSAWVHLILWMGIYQIVCMEHVPDSAACNESVKLARRYAHGAAQGYVNGLLRNVSRTKAEIAYPTDPMTRLSVVYSCPEWITEKLIAQFGISETEEILKASHQKQPLTLRVNTLKCDQQALIVRLKEEGVTAVAEEDARCVRVEGAISVTDSAAYRDGLFTPQNKNSMMAVTLLAPKAGDTVLDLCAAPGGKTTMAAEMMENRGKILAFDIHPHKAALIEKAAKRLGISIIEAKTHDAAVFLPQLENAADCVLADVPCSGIGVIHKKPEIKWMRNEEDIAKLCAIQRAILETAARYVRIGGTLVYSTCTIFQDENGDQIAAFLERHSEYRLEREQLLLTHKTGGSGFYIAKLIRER